MNTVDIANKSGAVASIDTTELENAMCDLEVALTFTESIDNFIDQLRAWMPNRDLPEAKHAQILIGEMLSRLRECDGRLDGVLKQIMAARRAVEA